MPKYIFIFITLAILATPIALTLAQKGGLVPCGETLDANGNLGGITCGWCHLLELAQNIINFLALLLPTIATGMIVYAGVLYLISLGGSVVSLQKAHDVIKTAVTGLIIGLLSYFLVGTIINAVTMNGQTLKEAGFPWPWNQIQCQTVTGEAPSGGTATTSPGSSGSETRGTCQSLSAERGTDLCKNSPSVNSFLGCLTLQGKTVYATTYQGTHMKYSCHFGGRYCNDGSHAADFGFNALKSANITPESMMAAAQSCGGSCRYEDASGKQTSGTFGANHIHCNIANSSCGCN